MIKLVIYGDPRTKKNSQRIVRTGAYHRLLPSKAYVEYQNKVFLPQVLYSLKLGIDKAVNLKCLYYMKTRRKVDLANLLNATQDLLVEAGVLADDNSKIVQSVDGSRVYHDKDNPRVEVYIEVKE